MRVDDALGCAVTQRSTVLRAAVLQVHQGNHRGPRKGVCCREVFIVVGHDAHLHGAVQCAKQ